MADHIGPDQKHWGFPFLPHPTFLPCMVSLHQAEIKVVLGHFFSHRGQEATRTILCFQEQKAAMFWPFSHSFLQGCWDQALLSAPKWHEPLLIRGIILRVLQGTAKVPVPTAAPDAITWQGSHKRHQDQFFLLQRYKPGIKDTYLCLDRKLAMQSKEVPTDIKFSFLPTPLLLWGTQLSQSTETAFLLDWAGSPPQGKHTNTERATANNYTGLHFTWCLYVCTSDQVKETPTEYSYQACHSYWPSPQKKF